MGITLAQLYSGGSGYSASGGSGSVPGTEFQTETLFSIPPKNGFGIVEVSSTRYLTTNQYVFLSDGTNYGSFQITAISDQVLTLKNYGGNYFGSVISAGAKILPSGYDAIADLINYTTLASFNVFKNTTDSAIELLNAKVSGETTATSELDFPEAVDTLATLNVADGQIIEVGDWLLIENGSIYAQARVESKSGVNGQNLAITRQDNSQVNGIEPITFPVGSVVTIMIPAIRVESIPPTPTFANIQGFARDNADLESEIVALETAIDDNATAIATNATNIAANTTAIATNSSNIATKISAIPFGGYIETIADKTYPLFKPDRSYLIKSLRVKSDSGTCTWAVQIDGVNVTGLSAVSVSSTEQLINATGANTVTAGQRVTIVSTANSSAVDVEFTIMLEAG